ncbi:MAG TPA: peptidylprolyl isomerase [Arcobacter sp.]|nr:peptidylprolyl isomerase [Arcobacter sp.]
MENIHFLAKIIKIIKIIRFKMIKNKTIISFTAAFALTTSSVFAIDEAKVYASVNGSDITATDVSVVLKDPRIKFDTLPKKEQKLIIDQLIDKKLLANKALNSDISNSKVFKDTLAKTITILKQDLALQIWMQNKSKEIKISVNEVQKYYDDNKVRFIKKEEFNASHILLKTKNEANDIIDILTKSKNIKNQFTSLAKSKSIGPSGKTGGELGWFSSDKMVPEFSQATSGLKVGQFTKTPVKTQFGFHVIYLNDKKEAGTVEFDKVKADIRNFLGQTQLKTNIESVIKAEKSKAKITYK